MEYPAAVARHFERPANVGPLTGARIHRGEGGSAARGAWVVIDADIRDGTIARLAFRAFGCPWLIAACSRVTESLRGEPAAALGRFEPAVVAAELDVPARKLDALLVLQDALRNTLADWDTTQPAGPP